VEPSRESHLFDAAQKFGPLMQLVLPDERPGVFVSRGPFKDSKLTEQPTKALKPTTNAPCPGGPEWKK
jgi:hypothetical protein